MVADRVSFDSLVFQGDVGGEGRWGAEPSEEDDMTGMDPARSSDEALGDRRCGILMGEDDGENGAGFEDE